MQIFCVLRQCYTQHPWWWNALRSFFFFIPVTEGKQECTPTRASLHTNAVERRCFETVAWRPHTLKSPRRMSKNGLCGRLARLWHRSAPPDGTKKLIRMHIDRVLFISDRETPSCQNRWWVQVSSNHLRWSPCRNNNKVSPVLLALRSEDGRSTDPDKSYIKYSEGAQSSCIPLWTLRGR